MIRQKPKMGSFRRDTYRDRDNIMEFSLKKISLKKDGIFKDQSFHDVSHIIDYEEFFTRILDEFRLTVAKRAPTKTISNRISEEGYKELKEAAGMHGLTMGQAIEFGGWLLNNIGYLIDKLRHPEHGEETKKPKEKSKPWNDDKPISKWTRDEIEAFLTENWLQLDEAGKVKNWITFHSRWWWLKQWLIRDPEYGEAFSHLTRFIDRVYPDLKNRYEEVFKKKTWPEVRDRLRNLMLELLKHYEEVKAKNE